MHVIKRKTLTDFTKDHADAEDPMQNWFLMLKKGVFPDPAAVKRKFGTADILPGNRVVFNIKGNRYRIVAKINYQTQTVFIRFIGTHAEYDKINAESI